MIGNFPIITWSEEGSPQRKAVVLPEIYYSILFCALFSRSVSFIAVSNGTKVLTLCIIVF